MSLYDQLWELRVGHEDPTIEMNFLLSAPRVVASKISMTLILGGPRVKEIYKWEEAYDGPMPRQIDKFYKMMSFMVQVLLDLDLALGEFGLQIDDAIPIANNNRRQDNLWLVFHNTLGDKRLTTLPGSPKSLPKLAAISIPSVFKITIVLSNLTKSGEYANALIKETLDPK